MFLLLFLHFYNFVLKAKNNFLGFFSCHYPRGPPPYLKLFLKLYSQLLKDTQNRLLGQIRQIYTMSHQIFVGLYVVRFSGGLRILTEWRSLISSWHRIMFPHITLWGKYIRFYNNTKILSTVDKKWRQLWSAFIKHVLHDHEFLQDKPTSRCDGKYDWDHGSYSHPYVEMPRLAGHLEEATGWDFCLLKERHLDCTASRTF